MKYILVTGAGGGMGSSMADAPAAAGFCVIAMDRKKIPPRNIRQVQK